MTRTRLSRRLTRAEDAKGQFVEPLPIVDHAAVIGDADALATELAAAFRQKIEHYREWYKLSEQEAIDRITSKSSVPRERVLNGPAQDRRLTPRVDRRTEVALWAWGVNVRRCVGPQHQ